ncbi:MAG: M20 family metallopeptidase [Gammaproteobacteria bacterium]|nr:M20 family metallopeptidase [Gammaproteobacteria bacterium]
MDTEALKNAVCDFIDENARELVQTSHAIHSMPELAFHEFEAAKILTGSVEKAGLTVERGAYGLETAYATEFGQGDACMAILSEYDALPRIGHACGHNIIATMGLGASLALASLRERLPGRVRYLGTPAEEQGGGKEIMARDGAFDGVDAAMMVHPSGVDLETMPCICIAEVRVTYLGKSAHASAIPHAGVNALDALVTAYQTLARLRQHIRPTERIHGIFTEAGSAPNIVPDRASGAFYVRAANAHELADLKVRVQRCFDAGALSSGCEVRTKWSKVDYLDMNTNWPMAKAYRANAESLGREFFPMEKLGSGGAGSTDMGNVSHRVPSIHPMIACAPRNVVIHNPEFAKWAASEMGDTACIDGAKAMAMTTIDYFADNALRREILDAFRAGAEKSAAAIEAAWHPDGVTDIGGCDC